MTGFRLLRVLRGEFIRACAEKDVPLEAVARLTSANGRDTLLRIAEIIRQDWHTDQPARPSERPDSALMACRDGIADNDTVKVPFFSALDLIAKAKIDLQLTYHDPLIESWDFMSDDQGRTFRPFVWQPVRRVTTREVRDHFREMGCQGNAAAFVSWVIRHCPNGRHATIPEDDRLWHHPDGKLYTICFPQENSCREFRLGDVAVDWGEHWAFVGFQEAR